MKNRRDVCAASEAGFIQYPSLPGAIKTGCQVSPLRSSKYCFHHAPRISKRSLDCNPETEAIASPSTSHQEEGVVKFITGKKITRRSTYYQVCSTLNELISQVQHLRNCTSGWSVTLEFIYVGGFQIYHKQSTTAKWLVISEPKEKWINCTYSKFSSRTSYFTLLETVASTLSSWSW